MLKDQEKGLVKCQLEFFYNKYVYISHFLGSLKMKGLMFKEKTH